MRAPSKDAIERRIKSSIEELLTRPLKESDPRRLGRSMPGMRDYIVRKSEPWYILDYKRIPNTKLAGKDKSNPVRRA